MAEKIRNWFWGTVTIVAVVAFFYVLIVYGFVIPFSERTGCINAGYAGTIEYNAKTFCVRMLDGELYTIPYSLTTYPMCLQGDCGRQK